ncbi:NTP transferase domain-containing protein [Terrisporobacter petrolearius]|uniref:DVU_1551 family NTP transferase n=1 Tax=Terrisporobacter petrolearius TaxID=1460447 RepID=UPI001D166A83|nr:NTP transferase domain-containing protein [Terrisporobacter petrolearius]MCC3862886.1 NTP transferase domain-containing protein [Terrisporobacter petrolearius]
MNISGLIVAAGLSSRMKDFKPLMKVENKPLIINTINSLKQSGIEDINIVVGYKGEDIENCVKNQNVNIIYNNKYESTFMYDSFKLGLNKMKNSCDAIIFLPGDVGFVSKYTIDLLIQEISKKESKIVYPVYRNIIGHPPIISWKCFDYLLSYNGKNGLKGGLDYFERESKEVDTPDKFILCDMDYKEDFYKVKKDFENRQYLSYEDCIYLLSYFNVPKPIVKHSIKVKQICEDLSRLINKEKEIININLINSAAILHDIKREEKNHEKVGAELLHNLGYEEIASIVKSHMRLEEEMENLINENTILYYSDKLVVEDEFSDSEKRFKMKLNKYKNDKEIKKNIIRKYQITLKIKSNIISIIGKNEYEKLENKWRGNKNDLFK